MADWRQLKLETYDPSMNMAIDEAILQNRIDGRVPNTLRLYRWKPSAVSIGKYIMQAAADCFGDEYNRCNLCNTGKCPRGITTQDPKLYRRLDADKVAERVVEVFKAADVEMRKIFAPMGRSTELPIGMSDGLSIEDKAMAERLEINYAC